MEQEYVYSYVTMSYVEYEPPIDYDAYDEYEDCEYYIQGADLKWQDT